MPVMRKPDRTKNRSTPRSPYLVTSTMMCSTQLVGSIWPTKWNTRTIETAKPRSPSSTGRCPRRSGDVAPLAGDGEPDVAAAPRYGSVVTRVCSEIGWAFRDPTLAQGLGAAPQGAQCEEAKQVWTNFARPKREKLQPT